MKRKVKGGNTTLCLGFTTFWVGLGLGLGLGLGGFNLIGRSKASRVLVDNKFSVLNPVSRGIWLV